MAGSLESKCKHFRHQLEKTHSEYSPKKYILIHTPETYTCGYAYLYHMYHIDILFSSLFHMKVKMLVATH